MSGLVVAVAFGRRQYETRTRGGAHLYRVTQYYDSWPFEHGWARAARSRLCSAFFAVSGAASR